MSGHDHDDFNLEPVKGLPEHLPKGERLLWQGAPSARLMARRMFHVPVLGAYFGLLMLFHGVFSYRDGASIGEIWLGASWMLTLAAIAIAILIGMSVLYAKTSIFTITSQRLVMRFGIALPMVVNIPLRHVLSADLRSYKDGSGDIVLTVAPHKSVSYVILWPNVRPWKLLSAQPALRCIPNAPAAAAALAAAAPDGASAAADRPAPRDVQNDETLAAVPS